MTPALLHRLGTFAATLAGILLLTFAFLHWLPGDPAQLYAGEEATAEDLERVRRRLGLDQPLPLQFAAYSGRLLAGDLGHSLRSGAPVSREIASRVPTTLRLAGLSLFIGLALALPAGTAAAVNPGGLWARITDWGCLVLLATPVYWLGLLLILGFSVSWRLLPPGGSEGWAHFVLPSLALGAHTGAATARILKSSLIDVLGRPYLRTARGKGAPPGRVHWVHALPNAAVPVITFLGMETGRLLGGAVLTETVFSLNGLGRFLVTSIVFRDFPCVLGAVLVMAAGVTCANMAADALCALLRR